jgi:hypothetical protein
LAACIFYEELMAAYPKAKVLLTVRNPERWYDSAESTIARLQNPGTLSLRALLFGAGRLLVPAMRRAPSMAQKIISEGTFGGHFDDRERRIEVFNRHNEEVRGRVPAERLLIYEAKEAGCRCAISSGSQNRTTPSHP